MRRRHVLTALFVTTALALVGNLATNTLNLDRPWSKGLAWVLLGVLFVAASVAEVGRWGGEPVGDQDVRTAVRDLEQSLAVAYADQAGRHGASPTQIEIRFRPDRAPLDGDGDGSERFALDGHAGRIVEAYRSLERRQLIVLGEPGAGKSVLALMLSWRLLQKRTAGEPVPVFLPISSWDPTTETVDDFIAGRLRLEHPKVFRRPEIARMLTAPLRTDDAGPPVQHLLPVLDGLDELAPERVPAAISKLHDWLAAGRPVVVTCRSREYGLFLRERPTHLEPAAVAEILPIEREQVIAFLGHSKTDRHRWQPVFDLLTREPAGVLAATLTTPLMVTMIRSAYQEVSSDPAELTRLATRTEIVSRLIDRYVRLAYDPQRPPLMMGKAPRRYRPRRAIRWLGTLAHHSYEQGTRDLSWRSLPLDLMNPRPEATAVILSVAGVALVAGLAFLAGPLRPAIAATILASAVALF